MTNINIDLFMTERFKSQWNSSGVSETPGDELEECRDWLENQWNNDFEDADHSIIFFKWSNTVIPESTLGSLYYLPQRRRDANDWLENNFEYWDSTDGGVVLDDMDTKPELIGQAYTEGGFDADQRTAHVDYGNAKEREDTLNWSTPIHNVTYHELGHLFGCDGDHKHGRAYYGNFASVMALQDEYECCSEYYDPDNYREDYFSICAKEEINDFIDNHT